MNTSTPADSWLSIALRPQIVTRSARVAAVVGTILAAINQGDLILAGAIDTLVALKICLTYTVPYCVSTWASVQTVRADTTRPRNPAP